MNEHSPQDRNFDNLTEHFSQQICASNKGLLREKLLWQEISTILNEYPTNKRLTILDAGGGQGQIACKLAQLGHNIIICDISSKMLAKAAEHAKASNIQLTLINDAIQNVDQYLSQPVDLVLCHAVLEWVVNPEIVLAKLAEVLIPNGWLSLMFYNYYALLFKNITFANFDYINQANLQNPNRKKKKNISPDYPRKPEQVKQWLTNLGLNLVTEKGIRIFYDYLIDNQLDPKKLAQLTNLEQIYATNPAYLNLARYIHFRIQK